MNTFGYIAKAIGPQDVLHTLLNNLKVHPLHSRSILLLAFTRLRTRSQLNFFAPTLSSFVQVQERQNRVCTTVAIAIVAETCAPFTVLPALVNEYRVPENNVQNGVLKVEFGRGGAQAHACRHIDIISYTYTDILFTYAQQVHTTLMCTHTI